ncbi:hypothetical protein DM860_016210 [Cuscuta australis]|uniref:Uncharacterized protein n=1 Tax=Cuscuta australis TaxID=267555 RepID=A0A328DUD2_9ASTE|nr:hypothetical protein DM860_016210 [Cuscuta australis]
MLEGKCRICGMLFLGRLGTCCGSLLSTIASRYGIFAGEEAGTRGWKLELNRAGKPLDAAVVLVLGTAVLVSRGWNDDELVVFDVGTFVGSIMELNSFLVAYPCLGRFSFKSTRFCLMCGVDEGSWDNLVNLCLVWLGTLSKYLGDTLAVDLGEGFVWQSGVTLELSCPPWKLEYGYGQRGC